MLSFLPPYLTYIKVGLVVAMLAVAGYAVDRVQHNLDQAKLDQLIAADDKAALEAQTKIAQLTRQQTDLANAASQHDVEVQTRIVNHTITLTKEIPHYVSLAPTPCISYGLVRVLDAAVLQADPDALPLPAGATDDTCSPITAADLAQSVVSNYAAAQANAQQLNDLETSIRSEDQAQDAAAKSQ